MEKRWNGLVSQQSLLMISTRFPCKTRSYFHQSSQRLFQCGFIIETGCRITRIPPDFHEKGLVGCCCDQPSDMSTVPILAEQSRFWPKWPTCRDNVLREDSLNCMPVFKFFKSDHYYGRYGQKTEAKFCFKIFKIVHFNLCGTPPPLW